MCVALSIKRAHLIQVPLFSAFAAVLFILPKCVFYTIRFCNKFSSLLASNFKWYDMSLSIFFKYYISLEINLNISGMSQSAAHNGTNSFKFTFNLSVRESLKFKQKIFYCKRVEGPAPGNFLISKEFLIQSKAYWALFLTQYITKS